MLGGTVAKWVALSVHSKKVLGLIPMLGGPGPLWVEFLAMINKKIFLILQDI